MSDLFFIPDDKLNRFKYAQFLENIIVNCDNYKRDSANSSYVIAVDSAWGTGKTHFFSMFENYLNGYKEQETPDTNYKGKVNVIKYNAWENDFWDNAFEPLMYTIINSDKFDHCLDTEKLKDTAKGIVKSVMAIAKGITLSGVRKLVGEDAIKAVEKEIVLNLKEYLTGKVKLFKDFNLFKSNISTFKTVLKNFIDLIGPDQKLLVIIDELDRCKPTFAIQTLEIVKHFFDIENLVFIFAVDVEQLGHSIKTVYGQEMDSTGYLCRFFDYISKIPNPNKFTFIESLISPGLDSLNIKKPIVNFLVELSVGCNLSLRDLATIIQSYTIMLDIFLKKYTSPSAHYIYLFYLALKYKNTNLFNMKFSKDGDLIDTKKFESNSFHAMQGKRSCVSESWNSLNSSVPLRDIKFYPCDSSGQHVDSRSSEISEFLRGKVYLRKGSEIILGDNDSLSNILFKQDLEKWEDIKNSSYRDYIYHQLEMFNFQTV